MFLEVAAEGILFPICQSVVLLMANAIKVSGIESTNVPECQRADRTSEAWRRCCGWCLL